MVTYCPAGTGPRYRPGIKSRSVEIRAKQGSWKSIPTASPESPHWSSVPRQDRAMGELKNRHVGLFRNVVTLVVDDRGEPSHLCKHDGAEVTRAR